jgi:hypothetical protein
MDKIKIGIDLDETLINNQVTFDKELFTIKKGVIKHLPSLYLKGFEFHLITARTEENKVNSIVKQIEYRLDIKFASITLTHFTKKGLFASKLGCNVMIDDCPEYLLDCIDNNVAPILLQNKKCKYKKMYPTWTVCSDWNEITELLLKLFK